jgi:hypothetical protein
MLSLPRLSASALALLALATPGCVDKEKCDEAIRVTRDALTKEQPDIARQWRERAWKICNDATTTSALDKEIVDKEAALAKRAADQAQAVADAAQQRMHTSMLVWRGFDKLDEKDRTDERLLAHKEKADHMSQGLPPEYAKQVDDYNEKEFARRQRAVEAAKAAAKK